MREFETQENAFYAPGRDNHRRRRVEQVDVNNRLRRDETFVSWRQPLDHDPSTPDESPERLNTEGVDEWAVQ